MLTPGRYVGAVVAEEDDVPFEERMAELMAKLGEQFKEAARLEETIRSICHFNQEINLSATSGSKRTTTPPKLCR